MQSDILQVYITPGLLAGLWEFPSTEVESDSSKDETWQSLLSVFQLPADVKHSHRGMVNTHMIQNISILIYSNFFYLPQPPIPFLLCPSSLHLLHPLTSLDSSLPPSLPPKGGTSVFSSAPPLPRVAHHLHSETETKSGPCRQ